MADMAKNLHTRYPEYNRKKYKVFVEICEKGFDFLQKSTVAQQDPPPETIEVSESRYFFRLKRFGSINLII